MRGNGTETGLAECHGEELQEANGNGSRREHIQSRNTMVGGEPIYLRIHSKRINEEVSEEMNYMCTVMRHRREKVWQRAQSTQQVICINSIWERYRMY